MKPAALVLYDNKNSVNCTARLLDGEEAAIWPPAPNIHTWLPSPSFMKAEGKTVQEALQSLYDQLTEYIDALRAGQAALLDLKDVTFVANGHQIPSADSWKSTWVLYDPNTYLCGACRTAFDAKQIHAGQISFCPVCGRAMTAKAYAELIQRFLEMPPSVPQESKKP